MADLLVKNKKAEFNYHIEHKYVAGMLLKGSEVKSIRENNATISEAFCVVENAEIWIRNMHIAEYKYGGYANHDPLRPRKLLLNKKEISKIESKMKEQGYALFPIKMYLSERGHIKLEIGLGKGKKMFDKREDIKKKDMQRDMDRAKR